MCYIINFLNTLNLLIVKCWHAVDTSPTGSAVAAGVILLIISLFTGLWWPEYAAYVNRPKLTVIDSTTGKSPIIIRQDPSNGSFTIKLAIKNVGSSAITKKWYWHIFLPIDPSKIIFLPALNQFGVSETYKPIIFPAEDGHNWTYISRASDGVIYPNAILSNFLMLTFFVEDPEALKSLLARNMHYYLSTEYGYFPQDVYKYLDVATENGGVNLPTKYFASVPLMQGPW